VPAQPDAPHRSAGHAGARIRSLRLGTGLVLFAYVATHLFNHAMGLLGLEAMEDGRRVFLAFWRNPAASLALYGSLLIHFALALWSLYSRRHLRMPVWEAAQLLLGLAIPLLLTSHAIGTRLAHDVYGTLDSYARVLHVFWSRPDLGLRQILLLAIAWAHGCIGMHYWLRLMPWYPRAWFALAFLALLLPLLALFGYAAGLREIGELALRPGWVAQMLAAANAPSAAGQDALAATTAAALAAFAACLALTLVARSLRNVYEHHRRSVRIGYPDGRVVVAPIGFSVLEASRFGGIPHASVCGGRGRCSTCRVRIDGGAERLEAPGRDEQRVLTRVGAPREVRLACQLRPRHDIRVNPLLPASATARDGFARPGYVAGQEREICVFFADLRGFTRFAERRMPYDVVFFLNRYFEVAGEAIERSGGVVNQFVGDGVMALFGVESGPERGCREALDAAGALVRGVAGMSKSLGDDLADPLSIGIGIHVGTAVVGEMGRGGAVYLTAVGDTVNVASRLQDLTRRYACQLIVSDDAARRAGVDVTPFERHELVVRNRSEPIAIRAINDAGALAESARALPL
jgi:adenylate cyclase